MWEQHNRPGSTNMTRLQMMVDESSYKEGLSSYYLQEVMDGYGSLHEAIMKDQMVDESLYGLCLSSSILA